MVQTERQERAVMEARVGFDLGDVVIDVRHWRQAEPPVPFRYAPEIADALATMGQIVRLSPERTAKAAIISKVQDTKETLEWIDEHDLFGRTGILAGRLRFCREHVDKRRIARELGLTHFVDNKLEVLLPMIGVVPNLYHFGAEETREGIYPMPTWRHAPPELL